MRKMMSFLLVLCMLLPIAAYAQELVPEDGAELTIMGGAHLVSVTEIALKDFMAQHPEIKINFEKYSYAEYPTKMRTQMSAGDSTPDVLLVHDVFIRQFIDAGYLMPLDEIVDKTQYLDVFANVEAEGLTYGLPNQCSVQVVFIYRKDIYEKLGLAAPATYEEYVAQAQILKENGYYAGAMDPTNTPDEMFRVFLYMMGGSEMNAEGSVTMDKAAKALTLFKECYDSGIWHNSWQANSEAFWTAYNSDKIACFPALASHVAYFESNTDPQSAAYGNLGIASAFTFGEDAPKSAIGNVEYFAINNKTRYPNAAKILVKYLCGTEEASLKFSNVNENGVMARYANGYLPGIQAIINHGAEPSAVYGGEQMVAWLAQNLMDTMPKTPVVDARTAELRTIISETIGEMLVNGTFTPESAVEEILFQSEML